MAGLIALVVAALVFWLVLKTVFLIGSIVIALAVAVGVYFVAEKLIGRRL